MWSRESRFLGLGSRKSGSVKICFKISDFLEINSFYIKKYISLFQVILAPSPKYTGTVDEPPRFMGEGFVVMSSSKIQFYYKMDEAGIVPAPSQVGTSLTTHIILLLRITHDLALSFVLIIIIYYSELAYPKS